MELLLINDIKEERIFRSESYIFIPSLWVLVPRTGHYLETISYLLAKEKEWETVLSRLPIVHEKDIAPLLEKGVRVEYVRGVIMVYKTVSTQSAKEIREKRKKEERAREIEKATVEVIL